MGIHNLEDLWDAWCPARVNNNSQPETCKGKGCAHWRWEMPDPDDPKARGRCGLSGPAEHDEQDIVRAIEEAKKYLEDGKDDIR